jgi:pheromone a factor receptor
MHPERAICAFLASFAVLLPFPYHWRTRNVGGVSLIIWLFLSCFIFAIDAVVWIDNARVMIPVWCDISQSVALSLLLCHASDQVSLLSHKTARGC